VVDFLICEIEDTLLDGLHARRQLPYAHYLCHIFVQLVRPPQFHGTLEASRLQFGSYHSDPEDPVLVPDLVSDVRADDETFIQFETQGAEADTSSDDDEGLGILPLPLVPTRSHDHEAGSSSAAPAAPPAIDPAMVAILRSLTWQQAHMAAEQARQAAIQQQMSERMLVMFQTIQDR
jgi:hypothetical protein